MLPKAAAAHEPAHLHPSWQVVLCPDRQRLYALPRPARESILALSAAFLPHYCNREVRGQPGARPARHACRALAAPAARLPRRCLHGLTCSRLCSASAPPPACPWSASPQPLALFDAGVSGAPGRVPGAAAAAGGRGRPPGGGGRRLCVGPDHRCGGRVARYSPCAAPCAVASASPACCQQLSRSVGQLAHLLWGQPLPRVRRLALVALSSRGAHSHNSATLPLPRPMPDTLSKEIRAEGALLRYLHMLLGLRGRAHLALATTATRVRLQARGAWRQGKQRCTEAVGRGSAEAGQARCCPAPRQAASRSGQPAHRAPACPRAPPPPSPGQGELYLLTQPGGPRYAPRRVNKLAGEVLDALFPAGRRASTNKCA